MVPEDKAAENLSVIVSRHPAAIQFIAEQLGGTVNALGVAVAGGKYIPVVAFATEDSVRGKLVYGNVPLSLACSAAAVCVIEFQWTPPRGQEYSLADMKAAGACLRWYGVLKTPEGGSLRDYLHQGGFEL